jgi:hypothetical protein
MARSFNICPQIDPIVITRVPGVALDTLFLIVIQALAVIFLGRFLHLFLRRYNQPSAVSQILVRIHYACSVVGFGVLDRSRLQKHGAAALARSPC